MEGAWICVECEDSGWTALDCEKCDSFVTGDVERIQCFACHRCEEGGRKCHEEEMKKYHAEIESEI